MASWNRERSVASIQHQTSSNFQKKGFCLWFLFFSSVSFYF
jgi:hypothetical protein